MVKNLSYNTVISYTIQYSLTNNTSKGYIVFEEAFSSRKAGEFIYLQPSDPGK